MSEIVYSKQRGGFEKGRIYENPLYFAGFTAGITHAYIIGNWPEVVKAAKAENVPYTVLKEGAKVAWKDGLAPAKKKDNAADSEVELVEISENWRKFGAPRLIELAQEIAGRDDIKNRKDATRVVEDELERRAAAEEMSPAEGDDDDNE